jgi:4-hydroxybenzoate polyprenyltransferase
MMLSAFRYLVYANFWVAFGALSMYVCSTLLLGVALDVRVGMVVFFGTVAVYNFHRVFRLDKLYNGPRSIRQQWIVDHARHLWVIIALAVALLGYLAFDLFSMALLLSGSPALLVALLYVMPVIKMKKGSFRLRDLPFLKLFLVSFSWAYVTLVFPLVVNLGDFSFLSETSFWLHFSQRLLFIFAITIPFDFRDLEIDIKNGVKTFANQMGIAQARKISLLSLALFALLCMLSFQIGYYTLVQMNALVLSALFTGFMVGMANEQQPENFFAFFLEGTMIDQLFWLVVLQYLFA